MSVYFEKAGRNVWYYLDWKDSGDVSEGTPLYAGGGTGWVCYKNGYPDSEHIRQTKYDRRFTSSFLDNNGYFEVGGELHNNTEYSAGNILIYTGSVYYYIVFYYNDSHGGPANCLNVYEYDYSNWYFIASVEGTSISFVVSVSPSGAFFNGIALSHPAGTTSDIGISMGHGDSDAKDIWLDYEYESIDRGIFRKPVSLFNTPLGGLKPRSIISFARGVSI